LGGGISRWRIAPFLAAAFLCAAAAQAWFAWKAMTEFRTRFDADERSWAIERLRGTLAFHGEAAAVSASLAAATGDPQWIERARDPRPVVGGFFSRCRKAGSRSARQSPWAVQAAEALASAQRNAPARSGTRGNKKNLAEAQALLSSAGRQSERAAFFCKEPASLPATCERERRLAELRGVILRLDETLTMSARLAAATGDLAWEERYRDHELPLDAAIKEALLLAPGEPGEKAASKIDQANIALIDLENQSFDLVRQGKKDLALSLLSGAEYEKEKKNYSEGLRELELFLDREASSRLSAARQRGLWSFAGALTVVILFAVFFLFVLTRLDRSERLLRDRNRHLQLILENLNRRRPGPRRSSWRT
jgi:hypothetical protein